MEGQPKKKCAQQREQALARVAAMAAVRARDDPASRTIGELALTRAWVDSEHLNAEPLLHDLMWVEYRYMSVWERSERFHREYVAAYRRGYAKHISAANAKKKRPVSDQLAGCSPDEINALVRARADADACGMPYDLYCDIVLEGHMVNDKWAQVPRPNQLYGKLDGPRARGRPTVEEVNQRLLTRGWDERFFADSEAVDSVQEAAWALLRKVVQADSDPIKRLGHYLRSRQVMSDSHARIVFGDVLVDAVAARSGPQARRRTTGSPLTHTRSCFGHMADKHAAPCDTCPIRNECEDAATRAVSELIATLGSDDPRRDHKRKVDRERQRRHRERTSTSRQGGNQPS